MLQILINTSRLVVFNNYLSKAFLFTLGVSLAKVPINNLLPINRNLKTQYWFEGFQQKKHSGKLYQHALIPPIIQSANHKKPCRSCDTETSRNLRWIFLRLHLPHLLLYMFPIPASQLNLSVYKPSGFNSQLIIVLTILVKKTHLILQIEKLVEQP